MHPLINHRSSQVSTQQLCQLAGVSRCGYYRYLQHSAVVKECDSARSEIQQICAEYPSYGYRRVSQELHRRAYCVNHKRVLALMRKDNLLCRPKRRWVRTTESRHGYRVYPNLARAMSLTHPDELWVADITYIRLVHGFAYLAVILDAFSRRAVGWAVSSRIDTKLSLAALTMALRNRIVTPGLVHHSDQGVQYACNDYVALLLSKNIAISMSRKGNPYDNALAESFIKTLKTEEVSLNEYNTLIDAQSNIEHFIGRVYNQKRLHSSLGYKPPIEFEAQYAITTTVNPSTLTLSKTVSV
jgi:transposase InsO family protein